MGNGIASLGARSGSVLLAASQYSNAGLNTLLGGWVGTPMLCTQYHCALSTIPHLRRCAKLEAEKQVYKQVDSGRAQGAAAVLCAYPSAPPYGSDVRSLANPLSIAYSLAKEHAMG